MTTCRIRDYVVSPSSWQQLWQAACLSSSTQSLMAIMLVIINIHASNGDVLAFNPRQLSNNGTNSSVTLILSPILWSETTAQNFPSTDSAEVSALRNITSEIWKNIDTTSTDPCLNHWPGVSCHTGKSVQHVIGIRLEDETGLYSSNFLCSIASLKFLTSLEVSAPFSGSAGQSLINGNHLPSDLGTLQHLMKLDLNGSLQLQGSIPSELGNLANLQYLNLRRNNLSGAIPQAVCQIQSLRYLDLGENKLTGVIPLCIGRLTNLTYLALDANQLKGSIPGTIGQLSSLTSLNLEKNQLTGEIPDALTNLPFLKFLSLGNNLLAGQLPANIGRLRSLQTLDLNFNAFLFGSIPPSVGNLSSLTELKLYSANLSGTIPDEIGYLSNLTDLLLQSNRFEGLIPTSLKNLKSLEQLQMQGNQLSGSLPGDSFINLTSLQILSLQNNNFSGEIPIELTNLTKLVMLSMSFNMLSGSLPAELGRLYNLEALLLCGNQLSGPIPSELGNLRQLKLLDLSQNLLTGSIPESLMQRNFSNFQSDFSFNRMNGIHVESGNATSDCVSFSFCRSCKLADAASCCNSCDNFVSEFAINAGGPLYQASTDTGPVLFQEDMSHNSSLVFYTSPPCSPWALTASGISGSGIWSTQEHKSLLASSAPPRRHEILPSSSWPLYETARTGADSLIYYGNCLKNGNYVVELHFVEIQVQHPGHRIFDILIQGHLVHQHFDVVSMAGGPLKPLVMVFYAVVTEDVLSIHLQGRGSWSRDSIAGTLTPYHGPIISAIRVFSVRKSKPNKARLWEILGGTIASLIILSALSALGIICFCRIKSSARRSRKIDDRKSCKFGLMPFEYEELEAATNKFSKENLLGQGAYGEVYRGYLVDGRPVAIKQLLHYTHTCKVWFYHELQVISSVRHRNLVPLVGCCIDRGSFPLLVCEYMPNGNLQNALFRKDQLVLSWERRFKIAVDVARGLLYLHEDSPTRIIHRDVKPANILLDKNMNAHISDFGLAELMDEKEEEIVVTSVMGTRGYLAPEYALRGQLSEKVDVYSYGIVLLELITGREGMQSSMQDSKQETVTLDTWAWEVLKTGKVQELADTKLLNQCPQNELLKVVKIGLWCTQSLPSLRPSMGQVLLMLIGQAGVPELPSERTSFDEFEDLPTPNWPSFTAFPDSYYSPPIAPTEGDYEGVDDATIQMLSSPAPSQGPFSYSHHPRRSFLPHSNNVTSKPNTT